MTAAAWQCISAGLWSWKEFRVSNHPRVFPRAWILSRDGREIAPYRTLAAAKANAEALARRDARGAALIDP